MSYYSKYTRYSTRKIREYSAMLQALITARVITQTQANKRFKAMLRKRHRTPNIWAPKAMH
jgi:hypothetical protein